jgi:hypothetical protein
MKKPVIPESHPPTREHMSAIKQNVEAITGRRGARSDLVGLQDMEISDPPTQAQVDKLRTVLIALIARIEG